eukprot:1569629-Rhodomonas_salina.1
MVHRCWPCRVILTLLLLSHCRPPEYPKMLALKQLIKPTCAVRSAAIAVVGGYALTPRIQQTMSDTDIVCGGA